MERRSKGLASRYFVPSLMMSTAQVADPEQPPLRLAASTTHTCRTLMSQHEPALLSSTRSVKLVSVLLVLDLRGLRVFSLRLPFMVPHECFEAFFLPSLLEDGHVQQSHTLDAASETQGHDRRESCKDSFCPSRLFLCSTSPLSEQSLGSHLAQYQLSAV